MSRVKMVVRVKMASISTRVSVWQDLEGYIVKKVHVK